MEQRPNQSAGQISQYCFFLTAGLQAVQVNAVYVQVQLGSKINAIRSDLDQILWGLSRVRFFF